MTESTSIQKHNKRRWFQISLRAFVLIVLVGSALTGLSASLWSNADRERKVVEYLLPYRTEILYDYQFTNGEFDADGVPSGPKWMRRKLGDHFFSSVTCLQINCANSLEGIECIQGLRQLELRGCNKLTKEQIDTLREALPLANIAVSK